MVKTEQAMILSSNIQRDVNEKNSIVRSTVNCTTTQTIVYLKNELNPRDFKEGTILSNKSRGVNSLRSVGRTKARNTQAAAFIPGVFEKISMIIPSRKAHNITTLRETPEDSFIIKYI